MVKLFMVAHKSMLLDLHCRRTMCLVKEPVSCFRKPKV